MFMCNNKLHIITCRSNSLSHQIQSYPSPPLIVFHSTSQTIFIDTNDHCTNGFKQQQQQKKGSFFHSPIVPPIQTSTQMYVWYVY